MPIFVERERPVRAQVATAVDSCSGAYGPRVINNIIRQPGTKRDSDVRRPIKRDAVDRPRGLELFSVPDPRLPGVVSVSGVGPVAVEVSLRVDAHADRARGRNLPQDRRGQQRVKGGSPDRPEIGHVKAVLLLVGVVPVDVEAVHDPDRGGERLDVGDGLIPGGPDHGTVDGDQVGGVDGDAGSAGVDAAATTAAASDGGLKRAKVDGILRRDRVCNRGDDPVVPVEPADVRHDPAVRTHGKLSSDGRSVRTVVTHVHRAVRVVMIDEAAVHAVRGTEPDMPVRAAGDRDLRGGEVLEARDVLVAARPHHGAVRGDHVRGADVDTGSRRVAERVDQAVDIGKTHEVVADHRVDQAARVGGEGLDARDGLGAGRPDDGAVHGDHVGGADRDTGTRAVGGSGSGGGVELRNGDRIARIDTFGEVHDPTLQAVGADGYRLVHRRLR